MISQRKYVMLSVSEQEIGAPIRVVEEALQSQTQLKMMKA